jgi:hypothetical protein
VSVHLDEGVDAGAVLSQATVDFAPDDTIATYAAGSGLAADDKAVEGAL